MSCRLVYIDLIVVFFALFFSPSLSSCIYPKSHPPIQQIGVCGSRPCFRDGGSGFLCSVPDTSER